MTHKLITAKGKLRLDLYYEIEGIPDQRHWNNKHTWRPTHVHIVMTTDGVWGSIPNANDLTVNSLLGDSHPLEGITVSGVKINKDGQAGKVPASEHYYSHASLPDWLQAIVSEAMLGLSYA